MTQAASALIDGDSRGVDISSVHPVYIKKLAGILFEITEEGLKTKEYRRKEGPIPVNYMSILNRLLEEVEMDEIPKGITVKVYGSIKDVDIKNLPQKGYYITNLPQFLFRGPVEYRLTDNLPVRVFELAYKKGEKIPLIMSVKNGTDIFSEAKDFFRRPMIVVSGKDELNPRDFAKYIRNLVVRTLDTIFIGVIQPGNEREKNRRAKIFRKNLANQLTVLAGKVDSLYDLAKQNLRGRDYAADLMVNLDSSASDYVLKELINLNLVKERTNTPPTEDSMVAVDIRDGEFFKVEKVYKRGDDKTLAEITEVYVLTNIENQNGIFSLNSTSLNRRYSMLCPGVEIEKVKTEINAAKKSFEDSISQAIAGVLTVKAGELSAKKEKVQNV